MPSLLCVDSHVPSSAEWQRESIGDFRALPLPLSLVQQLSPPFLSPMRMTMTMTLACFSEHGRSQVRNYWLWPSSVDCALSDVGPWKPCDDTRLKDGRSFFFMGYLGLKADTGTGSAGPTTVNSLTPLPEAGLGFLDPFWL